MGIMTKDEAKTLKRCVCFGKKEETAAMKSTGIVRRLDELGRVVLPAELRRTLEIKDRDEVEVYVENGRIILEKHHIGCLFCGASQELVSYQGKTVCRECISKMSKL